MRQEATIDKEILDYKPFKRKSSAFYQGFDGIKITDKLYFHSQQFKRKRTFNPTYTITSSPILLLYLHSSLRRHCCLNLRDTALLITVIKTILLRTASVVFFNSDFYSNCLCKWCKMVEYPRIRNIVSVLFFEQVLCLHLKRFRYSQFGRSKVDTYVKFPLQDLNMNPFLLRQSQVLVYLYILHSRLLYLFNLNPQTCSIHDFCFTRHSN